MNCCPEMNCSPLQKKMAEKKENHARALTFSLLDLSMIMFFFLPVFGQKAGEMIQSASLLSLSGVSPG